MFPQIAHCVSQLSPCVLQFPCDFFLAKFSQLKFCKSHAKRKQLLSWLKPNFSACILIFFVCFVCFPENHCFLTVALIHTIIASQWQTQCTVAGYRGHLFLPVCSSLSYTVYRAWQQPNSAGLHSFSLCLSKQHLFYICSSLHFLPPCSAILQLLLSFHPHINHCW